MKPTRTIVVELKQIASSPESVSLHRFIALVAAALVLLLGAQVTGTRRREELLMLILLFICGWAAGFVCAFRMFA